MTRLDPTSRSRRLALVATLTLAAPLLGQCDRRGAGEDAPAPATSPAPVTVQPPAPPRPLSRSEMLDAMAAASSDFAAGRSATRPDRLVGRAFEIRTAFACGGPQAYAEQPQTQPQPQVIEGLAQAQWGPEGRTIVLSLTPADWSRSALLSSGEAGSVWEAAEGFWIARPWLRTDGCPVVRGDPLQTGATPRSPETAGLAAVFETGGSRVERRDGRAYRFVVRGEGETTPAPPEGGYRLRLAGRLVGYPNGEAIRCSAQGGDQRPVCIAAVQLDAVSFETAEGAVLSRWDSG